MSADRFDQMNGPASLCLTFDPLPSLLTIQRGSSTLHRSLMPTGPLNLAYLGLRVIQTEVHTLARVSCYLPACRPFVFALRLNSSCIQSVQSDNIFDDTRNLDSHTFNPPRQIRACTHRRQSRDDPASILDWSRIALDSQGAFSPHNLPAHRTSSLNPSIHDARRRCLHGPRLTRLRSSTRVPSGYISGIFLYAEVMHASVSYLRVPAHIA